MLGYRCLYKKSNNEYITIGLGWNIKELIFR